ncbi:MAG: NAD-glutamate dehydrogenase [Mariprofundus sp.]|nr:NAD-glutamate dehydrogenase [Mariprofundus sp.]
MRHLRHQLITLLDQARRQHRMDTVQPRLMASLVQDFLTLLPKGKSNRVDMHARTLSYGNLHRHIFTIRCPDQAFYLDAIKGYLLRQGIQPIGQQTMVARMACGPDGCELELRNPDVHDEDNFMFIALHISATLSPDPEPIRIDIQAILQSVDLSVSDFSRMRQSIGQFIARLMPEKPDAAALLDWMNDNHYLFFGMQHGDIRLGLLRNKRVLNRVIPNLLEDLQHCVSTQTAGLIWVNLAAAQHYLYSAANIEVVQICWTEPDGNMATALLIGHCSRSARFANASYLPIMASGWRKLANDPLLQHSAFYRREIRTLFDRMPKRILLTTNPSDWLEPLKAIIDLADPMQLVATILPSQEGDLDTLMIAMTAKRYGPTVLQRMLVSLHDAGLNTHEHESFGIGPHRIILIGIDQKKPDISAEKLHDLICQCIVFWKDIAKTDVLKHSDIFNIPETLKELESIPPLYQELFPPAQFTGDIQMRRRVLANRRSCVHITPREKPGHDIELRIYSLQQPSLGTLVDIIRAFDLDPVQEAVVPFGKDPECAESPQSGCGCIHISSLTCHSPRDLDTEDDARLRRALALVLNGEADRDPANALLISAGLDIDDIAILITLRNHLIQLMPDAAKLPLTDMMLRHASVSACLHQMFASRHVPDMPESNRTTSRDAFQQAMQGVASLTDDRWFRALAELTEASLRTNAFIRETGAPIGIKIDPQQLSFAVHPKPYREIFVHGVHVEGIHLRAGPIARGGLRYSDRPADFRTEVLELMSTQVIKNGQIVPTGSKGGFVVRGDSGPDFVLQQYRSFIRTLLDLTDNFQKGEAIPPKGMVIAPQDADDPYFVVAADKGTARFSDDANEESSAAGFWLDDAFASGGRHGYDHKVVGITARGAWICAEHHFAKLGIDASRDPISCVGIGDMGGDVFGNGMLLNPALKLLAAFNHQHIFLDPNPDIIQAYAERQRLFASVSGWGTYNTKLISTGGGVFARSAKQITLSDDVRRILGIDADSLSGEALIRAILSAPVDLLYNGGIGTYVKASDESHAQVRDPANNAVRIDATGLRCKVVCEGGNLGFTQKARIEYAQSEGIINTDAMDNSAGVDMSDHEVNLKTLFSSLPSKLPDKQRNRLLEKLTDTVTKQCLDDNLLQSRVLTLAELDALQHLPRLQRLRNQLADEGWLDPAIAPCIDDDACLPLRPQISVLLGQEKNRIHQQLSLESFGKMSAFSSVLLKQYFPGQLYKAYSNVFAMHPLADEIIHTEATNTVINQFGLVAVYHLQSMLDASTSDIVEALLIADTVLDHKTLRTAIWQCDSDIDTIIALQRSLQEYLMLFAEELSRLCPIRKLDANWIERQRKGLIQFSKSISNAGMGVLVGSHHADLQDNIANSSLNQAQSLHMAAMPALAQSACALHLASTTGLPLKQCLKASQACLALLPVEALEAPLRTPDWGDEDAHNLRREWLHRLTMLKNRAINQLLQQPDRQYLRAGRKLWHSHRLWPHIKPFIAPHQELEAGTTKKPGEPRRAESRRMRLLLALTRLESIIDNN